MASHAKHGATGAVDIPKSLRLKVSEAPKEEAGKGFSRKNFKIRLSRRRWSGSTRSSRSR